MVIRCAVYGCKSSNRDDERLFYPFPKDELRCSAWVEALDRPELYRMSAQELHDDYRVCDLHFIFLDHHKILLDDSVPCIIVPKEFYLNQYNIPRVADDAAPGVSEPQEPNWKDDIPEIAYEIQSSISIDDGLNKSTQTDYLKTSETACQTDHEVGHSSWHPENSLQLLTTVECEVLSNNSDTALGDIKLTSKNDVVSLMCQPDISFIMSEDTKKTENMTQKAPRAKSPCRTKAAKTESELRRNTKSTRRLRSQTQSSAEKESNEDYVPTENVQSRKVPPAKRSCKTAAVKHILKQNRNTKLKSSRRRKSPSESSSEYELCNKPKQKRNTKSKSSKRRRVPYYSSSENDEDFEPVTKLDEAIKLVQQQWKIYEQNYNETVDTINDPVDHLHENQGRFCSNELKYIALYLYYSNLTAYNTLRQPLNLPSDKTIRKARVGVSTKMTPTVIKCLELKVNKLNDEEKFCIICVDLLPLKTEVHKFADTKKYIGYHEINEVQWDDLATKTLVVVVKGLYHDWIQPLTTCYLKDNFDFTEVSIWLDEIITILIEIGLKVICVTSNDHPDMIGVAKERCISIERPYFFVNDHKIYYTFDLPYTMMSLRNLFFCVSHVIYIDVDGTENIASWFDIEKVFATDQTRSCKLAPQLTDKHIIDYLVTERNGIQLGSEIFSNNIAAGIVTCIEEKHLTEKSFGTVKLVELINNVYEILSSPDEKDLFSLKDQIDVLEKMISIIQSSRIIAKTQEDITESLEALRCLGMTIRSILCIASDQKLQGFDNLCPANLTLEPLYVFFESLRKKLGNRTTAVLFNAGFRRYFIENLIEKSESSDCCNIDKDLISVLIENSKNDVSYRKHRKS